MDKIEKQFLKQIQSQKGKKIVFWGASVFLEEFLNNHSLDKLNIVGIIDKNESKKGQKLNNYNISTPNDLDNLKPDIVIIAIKNLTKAQNSTLEEYIKSLNPNIKIAPNILVIKKEKSNLEKYKIFIKLLDKIIPKKKNKCVFLSYPDYSDNAKEYSEYLKLNHPEYKLIWLYEKETSAIPHTVEKYHIDTFKSILNILTAKYLIYTHTNNLANIFTDKKHTILQLWHGMPLKTLGYTEKNISENLLKNYDNLSKNAYFFVTSDIFKLSMISCFRMNPNKVFITGQARTDCIFDNKNTKKISYFLNSQNFSKIVLYTPTYKEFMRNNHRDIDKTFQNIFYCDDYSQTEFLQTLESKNILFIVKPHPMDENFYQKYLAQGNLQHPNIKFVFDKDMKENNFYFYEFFNLANLMITDFSSIGIDYLITQKPIIFLTSTEEEYSKNRGFILEDNYKKLMPDTQAKTFKELMILMTNLLAHDAAKAQNLNDLSAIHKYLDGKSCERIFEIMQKL